MPFFYLEFYLSVHISRDSGIYGFLDKVKSLFDVLGSQSEDQRLELDAEVWELTFIAVESWNSRDLRDFAL